MQLDTAIEQRKREVNNVSNDIYGEKEQNENMENNLRGKQLEVLNAQLEKQKVFFTKQKLATMGSRYNEIATSKFLNSIPPAYQNFRVTDRFQPQMQEDQAGAILEQERQRNQVIEGIIGQVGQQNPQMQEILAKFNNW